MIRSVFYFLMAFGWLALTCTSNPNPVSAVTTGPARQDSVLAEPDAADLLQTLQGKWQSEQDSTYVLEIVGDKMKHYNGSQVSIESQIEIDGNCLSVPCQVDSTETASGWCFMEKGQYDVQCNLILKCDKYILQYRALGAANPGLAFKKK